MKAAVFEARCVALLGKGSKSASELSRSLTLGRTTVQYGLRKLQIDGKVRVVGKGEKNAVLWGLDHTKSHSKSHVTVFHGNDFSRAYHHVLSLPKGATLISIQGATASRLMFRSLPRTLIIAIQKSFKKKRIVIKGMLHKTFIGTSSLINLLDADILAAHVDRATSVRCVTSGNFLLGEAEIVLAHGLCIVANHKKRTAVVLRGATLTTIVYEVASLLFESLERHDASEIVDLNANIRSALRRKSARSET